MFPLLLILQDLFKVGLCTLETRDKTKDCSVLSLEMQDWSSNIEGIPRIYDLL